MSGKTLLTLAASALLGVVIAAPNAALAQFGPPPGPPPMLAGPPPGLGAGGPPLGLGAGPVGGPPAGPIAGFRLMALWPRHSATSPAVRLVSKVLADCVVSTAAAKPIFAASRVAPRPTALTATLEIVTPAMATGTGLMRRLRLTPMADPMPPPTTAATTCPPIGDMAPDAFWCVMETD